jgi:Phosphatidylinositol-glycan biosynthesis class S protein
MLCGCCPVILRNVAPQRLPSCIATGMTLPHVCVNFYRYGKCVRLQGVWAPIAARLSPLLSLRIETQQRLHARGRLLDPSTVRSAMGGVRLSETAIPFFVDSDSWALESGRIITGHTHPLAPDFHGIAEKLLHFVGYIPAADEQPMYVECGTGSVKDGECMGFVVEQWGGVAIMNSASTAIRASRIGEMANTTGATAATFCTVLEHHMSASVAYKHGC